MTTITNLKAAVMRFIDTNPHPEATGRGIIDPASARYQLAAELASLLLNRRVHYLAPASRVAKLASVVVINPAGKVLIVRRSADMPDAPGTWGFPGGEGKQGETFEQIAVRELLGETDYAASGADLECKGTYLDIKLAYS